VSFEVANRLLEGVNKFNLVTRQSQAGEERRFTEERLTAARASLRVAEDRLERFLRANRQLGSPGLIFERDRLQREVTLQQQVVVGLAQAHEDARIREVRDTPVITVIERPTLAAEPDPRGRLVILMSGTLIAFFVGILAALMRDGARRLRATGADPAFNHLMREWQQIRGPRE
jgi:uncharacterized protein involved in exopolysaccharide biosynthesis